MHGTRFSAPCRPVTQTSLPQGFPSEVGLVYVRGIVKTPNQPQLNSTLTKVEVDVKLTVVHPPPTPQQQQQ